MSGDPFHEVRAEVEAALHDLSATASSYARRSRTVPKPQHASDHDLQQTVAQLRAQLLAIEPDVEELEDAIAAIEEVGVARRLGISDSEVKSRRGVVNRIKGELEVSHRRPANTLPPLPRCGNDESLVLKGSSSRPRQAIRKQCPAAVTQNPAKRRPSTSSSAYPPSYRATGDGGQGGDAPPEDDPNAEFEMQHQSLLIEQQDRTLTDISGTVGLLREQAHLMGQEVYEQNQMLGEIDEHVDATSSRLAKAQNRMDRFVREHNSGSNWCIFILMVLLSILLFVILFM
ncbi:hypothetical protein BMF94_1189 [Rhodotorula taiwanensis]|uniref:t-SNARE coiled-coil homology domain-containing protein n=1 Tax=Rhodotorula taiwanensis TaxID=741276 RepID=A0A2S5BFM8_9BASI|nr:hypothetical protein BMF94_1189 [Rhodotorula taiwanensis]